MEALLDLGGRLAITDGSSLALADPSGANIELLDEVADGLIAQPTWSPDGVQIAWARADGDGSLELFTIESGERASVPTGATPPIYLQWTSDAATVGLLRNSGDEISLSTVDSPGGLTVLDSGAPFYFSWAPDNSTLAFNVGNLLQVQRRGGTDTLLDTNGEFSAPYWVNNEKLLVVRDEVLGVLTIDSGLVNELARTVSPTPFVLHAEAGLVAYLAPGSDVRSVGLRRQQIAPEDEDLPDEQEAPDEEPASAGPPVLRVVDVDSGEDVLVTSDAVVAWEWSPDGNRLAFLAPSDFDENSLRWYFWEQGRLIGATSEHTPSQTEQSAYLPFFAQYAQSHTRWSPTGAAFSFAGEVEGESGIWVHAIGATPQSVKVAEGDFVTWSPEDVAHGSGISPL